MSRADQKKKKKKNKKPAHTNTNTNTSPRGNPIDPTEAMLIGIAFVLWCTGVGTIIESEGKNRVEHLFLELTDMTLGADVHVDATVTPAPTVLSPLTKTPCVAARVDITYLYSAGKGNRTQHVFTLFVGPDPIPILALNTPLAFPRALWDPKPLLWDFHPLWKGATRQVTTLPPAIAAQIPPDVLAGALKARPKHFELREWVFTENMNVFVAGTLQRRDPSGTFILGPDPNIDEFILYPGTQTQFVRTHRNGFPGLLVISTLAVVLGFVLTAILIYLKWKRARRPQISLTTPPHPPSENP